MVVARIAGVKTLVDVRVGLDVLLRQLQRIPLGWTRRPRLLGTLAYVIENSVDHILLRGRDE